MLLVVPVSVFAQIGWTPHIIETNFNGARSVYAIDMDGDTDIDVLAVATDVDQIAWWENDGNQNFTKHTVDSTFDGVNSVFAVDLDGQNGLDLVSVARFDNEIAWWENDGNQNFVKDSIDYTRNLPICVHAADIDGDTDTDVVTVIYNDHKVLWHENRFGTFVTRSIDDNADYPYSIHTDDIDGQNGTDVVVAMYGDSTICWYENDGHPTPQFTKHLIPASDPFPGIRRVHTADIDTDGDTDILGAAYYANEIAWFENDGNENFTKHTLIDTFYEAQDVYAIDLDTDNDIDILGVSWTLKTIAWWENDGNENFSYHPIITNLDGAISVYAIDMDGDTDIDVLGAGSWGQHIVMWIESDLLGIEDDQRNQVNISKLSLMTPTLFNDKAHVTYQLTKSGHVELAIYDINGELLEILVDRHRDAGSYSVVWDTNDISSGVYFVHLKIGARSIVKKAVILK